MEGNLSLDHIGAVELHSAFMWDCPHCGTENFQRSISYRMTEEDMARVGISPEEVEENGINAMAMTIPNFVSCRDCKNRFRACDDMGEIQ